MCFHCLMHLMGEPTAPKYPKFPDGPFAHVAAMKLAFLLPFLCDGQGLEFCF